MLNHGLLNQVRNGEMFLVDNARAAAFTSPGFGNLYASGIGTMPIHRGDLARDLGSGAFLLGNVRLDVAAAAGASIPLYFRVGQSRIAVYDGHGDAITGQIAFGDTTDLLYTNRQGNMGDPLSDPAKADAVINVVAPGPAAPLDYLEFHAGQDMADPRPCYLPSFIPETERASIALNTPATGGKLYVRTPLRETVDIYFDLQETTPGALDAFVDSQSPVTPTLRKITDPNPLGDGVDYDLAVQYAIPSGTFPWLDFGFENLTTSQISIVGVGVPEPNTVTLASLLVIAAGVVARRRWK